MRVEIRPSRPEDFAALEELIGGRHPFRARTLTALADGEVLGIGGLVYMPNGEVWASVVMTERARRYPAAIHRAGRMAVALMRRSGARRVLACADATDARAARWLERLGFRRGEHAVQEVYVWRPHP